ncbi:MAG: Crp/Fnr family transcriptional regulator [Anaerolineae bacterium]|nr:Crp/Fnr family transcriptional regulator [Anaerolineae bacterium]
MSIPIDQLQRYSLFSELNEGTLSAIALYAILKDYQAGEIVQLAGDPCDSVAFIFAGAAQVYRLTLTGREQVLATLTTGMHFNSVPALIPDGREAQGLRSSVRAITPMSLFVIPVEPYRMLIKTYPDLAYTILTDFAKRLDRLTNLVEDLSLHSVRGRLAKFLLEQADKGELADRWTQDEIAAHLGTVRDVIGRTLRAFMDAGLVKREGARLVLLDRKKLEEEAQF